METRRLGRLEHRSSVMLYGAAALGEVSQDIAEASLGQVLAAGINHLDVAASYGEAELRMGPWVARVRDRIFLASKTGDRDAIAARASIECSLTKLPTGSLDLLQLHAVVSGFDKRRHHLQLLSVARCGAVRRPLRGWAEARPKRRVDAAPPIPPDRRRRQSPRAGRRAGCGPCRGGYARTRRR